MFHLEDKFEYLELKRTERNWTEMGNSLMLFVGIEASSTGVFSLLGLGGYCLAFSFLFSGCTLK